MATYAACLTLKTVNGTQYAPSAETSGTSPKVRSYCQAVMFVRIAIPQKGGKLYVPVHHQIHRRHSQNRFSSNDVLFHRRIMGT